MSCTHLGLLCLDMRGRVLQFFSRLILNREYITMHVDIQSVLMVNVFNRRNKSFSVCCIDQESWVLLHR